MSMCIMTGNSRPRDCIGTASGVVATEHSVLGPIV